MRAPYAFLCSLCVFISAVHSVRGNPLGGTVVPGSGAASFSSSLGTLTINQSTPRVIINWQDFSIAAGEVTRFVQPSASAVALNRVTTANPSAIFGTLEGNGAIYLINPNGILVGRSGQINVGSFLGSTLDFGPDSERANASFLSGAGLRLSGDSTASVRNEGYISALDDVFLVAHTVQNAGAISGHTVGLAAGADIELRSAGTERISVVAGNAKAQPGAADGVVNSGNIAAVSAELKAAGGNIYALAINNGGTVRATGIVKENGRILLRADRGTVVNSGTLDASSKAAGTKGGQVHVLGERVGLVGDSKIDVSGDAGGGTVLVGGDLQGKNPNVPNAQRTVVGRDSIIKADALSSGDGGKVIVWSDEATRYLGEISAKGAGSKGNGGFVEVSGKSSLTFDGAVNVAAAGTGAKGTVLLDPATITVQLAGPDINGNGTAGDDIAALTDLDDAAGDFPGADSIITAGAVNALLTGNNNLVLAASVSTTVNAAISGSDNASLTLNAPRVDLNAPITLAGSGVLSGTPTTVNVLSGGRIQNGVDVANPVGATVTVAAGTYAENISVSKGLTLRGAKFGVNATTRDTSAGESVINGQVRLERPNTTFDGFTVRGSDAGAGIVANNAAGDQILNNYITDNVFGLSLASDGASQILVQNNFFENNTRPGGASGNGIYTDFTVSNVRISANKFTGNPEGSVTFLGSVGNPQSNLEISDNFIVNPLNTRNNGPIGIGNITGVTIRRNTISEAGDAIWIGGGVDGATIENNLIQNNDGAGVKFARPSSSGIAATSRNILIRGNSFSANVDGGILVDAREGTRYTDAGNGNVLNASGNWWGSPDVPTVSVAVAPAGTINFRINMVGDPAPPETVDFSPWLNSGVNSVALGAPGFLGDLTVLNVSPLSPKATADGFIAEALTAPFNLTTRLQLFAGNYNDQATINIPVAVVLKGDVTLTAGTSVSFGSTVDTDGTARTLDVTSPSLTLGGEVGNVAAGTELGRLTASGNTTINGGIVRTRASGAAAGNQNYNGLVTLGADTTLSGVAVTLAAVAGGNRDLSVNASGVTTFNGGVSGVDELNTDAPGSTRINAATLSANTSIGIADQLELGSPTTLTAPAVTLAGVTGLGRDLTVNASGVTTFNGAVSGVDDLRTDAPGSTRVNTASVNAITSIGIADQLDLGINTTLSAPDVTLAGVTGNGRDLNLNASGATTLNGIVSGVGALTTDLAGNTVINGGVVSTIGSQTYNDSVSLGANTVLNNTTVSFGSTVNGGGRNLTLNSSGDVTLNGMNILNVGTFATLAGGSTRFSDGSLNANTLISIGDQLVLPVSTTLTAPAMTLAGVTGNGNDLNLNASGATTLNGIVSGVGALTTDLGGNTVINQTVNAGSVTLNDPATLSGVTITTTGDQIYEETVSLGGGDTTLSGGTIIFNNTVNALVSGLQGLTVNGDAIFGDFAGGDFVGNVMSLEFVNVSGSVTFNAGNAGSATVRTSGDQTYSGPVTLGADTTLTGADIALAGVGGGGSALRVNASGVTTFNGAVSGVTDLSTDAPGSTRLNAASLSAGASINLADQLDLGVNATLDAPAVTLAGVTGNGRDLALNASGATTINGAVSGVGALRTDAGGSTVINQTVNAGSVTLNDAATLNGGIVTTSGSQTYNDTVTLGANTILNNTTVSFASTVNAANQDLTLNSSGDVTLAGPSLLNLRRFTTLSGGSTTIDGGSLNAGTLIDIGDELRLGANTTLTAPGIALAEITGNGRNLNLIAALQTTLNGPVAGVGALVTDAPGNTVVSDTINAVSVTLNDIAELNGGSIITVADQAYNAPVTLGAHTTLSGANVRLAEVTGVGRDLAVNATILTRFNGPVNGVRALTTDSPGSTEINQTVNAGSVTLNDPATLNGMTVTTTGDQDYNASVTLGTDTTLFGANVRLAGVTGGGRDLQVDAGGLTRFNGSINGVGALITDAAGNTVINGSISAGSVTLNDPAALNGGIITTVADQDYNAAVTLGADSTLSGANLRFVAITGGGRDLNANASGVTTFNGVVSGVDDLRTDAGGSTRINTASVSANRSIDIADQLDLGIGTTLGAPAVTLAGVIGNGRNLALNASGVTTLNGVVSGVDNLSTDAGGSTRVNTASLSANASIGIGDQLDLGVGTTLGAATVTVAGVTGNDLDLALNASGVTTLNGVVSGVGNLSTDAGGNTVINQSVSAGSVVLNDAAALNGGTITTIADQDYNEAVTLGADATLSGANVRISAVTGAGSDLRVNAGGQTRFNGAISGVDSLSTDAGGSTLIAQAVSAGAVSLGDVAQLNGGLIDTSGDQAYSAVTLGAGTLLFSGGNINLAGSVNGVNNDLTVDSGGAATFGAVSGVPTLTLSAGNNVTFNSSLNLGTLDINQGANVTFNGNASASTLDIQNVNDILYNGAISTIDLLFNANGNVQAVNSGNVILNALVNCALWSAVDGFVVSDSNSGKAFIGTTAGTCIDIDNNEAAKRLASQLVPQVQFTEIQADAVEIRGIPLQKAGILTRSSELFVKPGEALTRSGEVNPGSGPGN